MIERTKLIKNQKILFREEDDIALLCNPDNGAINILNDTGRFIWPRLDGEKNREEIIEEMVSVFNISDRQIAENDFDKFIADLRSKGLLDGGVKVPLFPGNICLGITSICNLSCKHCLNRNVSDQESDMTGDEILALIDQLVEGKVKSVSLFGGEPLLCPDFKKIVEYLNKHNISISLNTNATLIDKDMAKWLKEHKVLGAVVSFDGSSSSVMDKIRGKGVFEKCLKGIEALRDQDIDVMLSVTLNKLNYKDVGEMAKLGKKIKGGSIRFNHVFYAGNAICFSNEIYLSPDEEKEAIEAVWQVKQEYGDFLVKSSSFLGQKEKMLKLEAYKPSDDKIVVNSCGAAVSKCSIRPDGSVLPCELIWDQACGNVKKNPLREIWQESEVMNKFRKPLVVDLNEIPECKGCKSQFLCFIGHRCYPYYFPGGIKNRALYCQREDKLGSLKG